MKALAYLSSALMIWGGLCGLFYLAETLIDQAWRRQRRQIAQETGTRPTYGTCNGCRNAEGTHLARPSLLSDPEPLCDACHAVEVLA